MGRDGVGWEKGGAIEMMHLRAIIFRRQIMTLDNDISRTVIRCRLD